MGFNQGLNRYRKGYTRKLTKSELSRGYFFISNDKRIKNNINLQIYVNNVSMKKGKIDNSGRIVLGRKLSGKIDSKKIHLKLVGDKIFIDY